MSHLLRFALAGVLSAVCALSLAHPAGAQNLLDNFNFDADVSGWTGSSSVPGGTPIVAFAPTVDADRLLESGSARLTSQAALPPGNVFLQQCVTGIEPGEEYFAEARLMFAPGETAQGFVNFWMKFEEGEACDIQGTDLFGTPPVAASEGRGVWFSATLGNYKSGVVAPPKAHSVLVYADLYRTTSSQPLSVFVDALVFAHVGEPFCHGYVANVIGTPRDDKIEGTPGDDVIVGLGGDDVIDGRGGDDIICGNGGNDVLKGGSGNDLLFGGPGKDTLRGGAGFDVLVGGPGKDKLYGAFTVDELVPSEGKDVIFP